jgi:hypothetical protein
VVKKLPKSCQTVVTKSCQKVVNFVARVETRNSKRAGRKKEEKKNQKHQNLASIRIPGYI